MVRPIVEYGIVILCPRQKKDIVEYGIVILCRRQKKDIVAIEKSATATKIVPTLRHLLYKER